MTQIQSDELKHTLGREKLYEALTPKAKSLGVPLEFLEIAIDYIQANYIPKPPSIQSDDRTLGELLGEVVGVAVCKELENGRWFTNWRTRDEQDKWTAQDFRQLKYPDDVGHIAGMCADIVIGIKPKVEALVQAHVDEAVRTVLNRLNKNIFYSSANPDGHFVKDQIFAEIGLLDAVRYKPLTTNGAVKITEVAKITNRGEVTNTAPPNLNPVRRAEMARTLNWDDTYCPKGHGSWVFIPTSMLYSDLYWCQSCDCFYEPTVKRLSYEELNEDYSTDRAADLIKRGKFMQWKDGLTIKDVPSKEPDHAEQ